MCDGKESGRNDGVHCSLSCLRAPLVKMSSGHNRWTCSRLVSSCLGCACELMRNAFACEIEGGMTGIRLLPGRCFL